ncbi:glucose 1-dehydrogenase [Streptomyces sp. 7-21]|uniref:glucose 1-dehydrogenase n=1 Tax=Streptomyces sp. 7-21 TaxID=2802283 RepID=UPI00191CE113|nr:glucose 1-dehydrogenase [Streptomyces sp. 7-21]MBL1068726.1 glucose 1-dehydrogenase [Streptomyces sp. 7-21]
MRALTVRPQHPGSLAVEDVPEPSPQEGDLLVEGIAVGVCATDREIAAGGYGWAPDGTDRLVLGHESFGRVREAPDGSGFEPGDLVAGVVRRPDPVPCGACARMEFDMCRNGRYTERGIKQRDGYASELWRVEPGYAVRLADSLARTGMLLEPATIVAKAWEQIERVGERSYFAPRRVLVTGAGPIGLLAAQLSIQRGLETHVLDRVPEGQKPALVRAIGAAYHADDPGEVTRHLAPDIVIEATGSPEVVVSVLRGNAAYGIVCLTGVSPEGRRLTIDAGGLNREIVLQNDAILGSVNANLRHYHKAADALAKADNDWLESLLTRRVPLERAAEAFTKTEDDIKTVIDL